MDSCLMMVRCLLETKTTNDKEAKLVKLKDRMNDLDGNLPVAISVRSRRRPVSFSGFFIGHDEMETNPHGLGPGLSY